MIKEYIVVEGKDDISAVKRAVDANLIATNGLGLTEKTLELIRRAQKRSGVIILTDPDSPGDKIRRWVDQAVPGCKHAFLPKKEAIKKDNLGVENASPQAIRQAIEQAKPSSRSETIHTRESVAKYDLLFGDNAAKRRRAVADKLHIGYGNGKQFIKKLNGFQISQAELEQAVHETEEEDHA